VKFLTKKNLADLPPLYTHERTPEGETPAPVKFFTPWGSWTWYATEYDPETGVFFGLVVSEMCPEGELGYFARSELEGVTGPFGLGIERDLHWRGTLADARGTGTNRKDTF
jgi:hypothetical protein